MVPEFCGDLFVENALLLKIGESIGVQNFCPFVAVISRGISSLKNMAKSDTHTGFGRVRIQTGVLKGFFLMLLDIGDARWIDTMPRHVQ